MKFISSTNDIRKYLGLKPKKILNSKISQLIQELSKKTHFLLL